MSLKFNDWRSERELDEERLSLTYHAGSAHHPELDVLMRSRMKMLGNLFRRLDGQASSDKRYFGSPTIPSSEADIPPDLKQWLDAYARTRASHPEVPFEELRALEQTAGFKPDQLELYMVCRNEEGQHLCYHIEEQGRELKSCGRPWNISLQDAFPSGLLSGLPRAIWFVAANLHRSHKLLGERGYRYSLLEAGRMAKQVQNCAPPTTDTAPIATFYDDRVNEWLGLDGIYEVALAAVVLYDKP